MKGKDIKDVISRVGGVVAGGIVGLGLLVNGALAESNIQNSTNAGKGVGADSTFYTELRKEIGEKYGVGAIPFIFPNLMYIPAQVMEEAVAKAKWMVEIERKYGVGASYFFPYLEYIPETEMGAKVSQHLVIE